MTPSTSGPERTVLDERQPNPLTDRTPNAEGPGRRAVALLLVGANVLVGLAAAAFFVFGRGPAAVEDRSVAVPNEGQQHVAQGAPIQYAHVPPASGTHYPRPLPWGVYESEAPEGFWVHNLEHGGLVLLFKCDGPPCAGLAEQVRALAVRLPNSRFGHVKLVGTPYSRLQVPFMMVAWDRQLSLTSLDENAISAFYSAYVDRGPEDVP
jgi:hypothetical protein